MYLANPDLTYADRFHMPRFTNGAFHVCLAALYKVLRTGWHVLLRLGGVVTQPT